MEDFLELIVSVGEAGSIYALVALAYLLVLRPSGIINFAVGEWAMMGGFAAVSLITWLKLPYIIGLPLSIICIGAIAWITGLAVVNPLIKRNASPMSKVLVLLGMLIVYRETSASLYGYDPIFVPMPFGFGRVEVGPFAGSSQSFFIISVVVAVFLLAWYFFERTIWGKAFEGVAINRQAAMLMGINLKIVGMSSFISAGMIAGLAGVLQAPLTSAHFLMGLPLAIKGFTALVIGGLGRVEGALLGGFLLALLEKLTIRYIDIPSGYALGVPLLLMIVFLLFRPNGIFQNKEAK